MNRLIALANLALLLLCTACGAQQRPYRSSNPAGNMDESLSLSDGSPSWASASRAADAASPEVEALASAEAQLGAAPLPEPQAEGAFLARTATSPSAAATTQAEVASDGRAGPLLIYEAELHMAVYRVDEIQTKATAIARELGGYLSEHVDRSRLVLRVPADKWESALSRIEALGEVSRRFARALDVTAEFRDLQMRLRNAEAMRDRLLKLLDKADSVKASLEVERELDRVSERIERMKGELKLMGDRLAFSSITLHFTVKHREVVESTFELPFPFLQTLGLQDLLRFP